MREYRFSDRKSFRPYTYLTLPCPTTNLSTSQISPSPPGKDIFPMDDEGAANQTIVSEIEHMPEAPRQRISQHRRARSDTFFTTGESIDDLLLFDPSDIDFSSLDFLNTNPTSQQPQASPMSVDSPSEETSSNGVVLPLSTPLPPKPFGRHVRSLSVDSDFFDDLGVTEDHHQQQQHHHRSSSMDGDSSSSSFNIESILAASVNVKDCGGLKKNMGMGGDRLAELALLDPKRAKR